MDDLDPEDVMSSLLTLLHRPEASLSESWSVILLNSLKIHCPKQKAKNVLISLPRRLPVLTEAVRLLSGSWLGTEKRLETVGWRLLPLLVVSSSSSSQLSLASCVGHSTIMAQQPLTQNWSKGELEPKVMPSAVLPAAPSQDEALPNTLDVISFNI